MLHPGLTYRLLLHIVLIVGSSITAFWFLGQERYLWFAIAIGLLLWSVLSLVRMNRENVRKLMFMFDSIENGDYSFKFRESGNRQENLLVNDALNRIKTLLTKARDETIDQEKYYQIILESVTTGIVIVNPRGNVVQTNREGMRVLGLDTLTHINQLAPLDERFPGILREIRPGESRQLACNNAKGAQTLSIHASELQRRGETFKILTITDIENELSDREIESWIRLIRVLTHEIMNSVNPITSISESLSERIEEQNIVQIKQGLDAIGQTAKSLISFVESYRKFTALPAPKPTLFYLRDFLANLRSIALATVPEEHPVPEIEISVEPDDLILYADQGQISQVTTNLLKNAIEATGQTERPCIRVRATVDSREQVILSVEDNGPGISAEMADHIFVPFFTTKTGGSGIGLSLSRHIMRLHGGTLRYRPGEDGTGSVFTMTFK